MATAFGGKDGHAVPGLHCSATVLLQAGCALTVAWWPRFLPMCRVARLAIRRASGRWHEGDPVLLPACATCGAVAHHGADGRRHGAGGVFVFAAVLMLLDQGLKETLVKPASRQRGGDPQAETRSPERDRAARRR